MKTLKNQILFGILLLILIPQALSSWVHYQQTRAVILESLTLEAESMSIPLMLDLSKQLSLTNDKQQIEDGLLKLFAGVWGLEFKKLIQVQQHLLYIEFITPLGEIIAHSDETVLGQRVAQDTLTQSLKEELHTQESIDQIEIGVPYFFHDQFQGTMLFHYSAEPIREKRNQTLYTSLILMAIYLAIVGGGALLLSYYVTGRIKHVIRSVNGLISNDADLTKRLVRIKSDEVGDLVECFNLFIDHVNQVVNTMETEANSILEDTQRTSQEQEAELNTELTMVTQRLATLRQFSGQIETHSYKDKLQIAQAVFPQICQAIAHQEAGLIQDGKMLDHHSAENTPPIINALDRKKFEQDVGIVEFSLEENASEQVEGSLLYAHSMEGSFYLFRPHTESRFTARDIEFVRVLLHQASLAHQGLHATMFHNNPELLSRLLTIRIQLEQVLYLTKENPDTLVVFKKPMKPLYLSHWSLQGVESFFKKDTFLRVHRSYLVNPLQVTGIREDKKNTYHLMLTEGKIPVGITHIERLKEKYPQWFK